MKGLKNKKVTINIMGYGVHGTQLEESMNLSKKNIYGLDFEIKIIDDDVSCDKLLLDVPKEKISLVFLSMPQINNKKFMNDFDLSNKTNLYILNCSSNFFEISKKQRDDMNFFNIHFIPKNNIINSYFKERGAENTVLDEILSVLFGNKGLEILYKDHQKLLFQNSILPIHLSLKYEEYLKENSDWNVLNPEEQSVLNIFNTSYKLRTLTNMNKKRYLEEAKEFNDYYLQYLQTNF
jgi:hypothetical protein